jgi:Fe-S cluster biogenesis protein NfuA
MHPERTGDDAVLRWVVHHPLVDSAVPGPRRPASGPLRALLDEGAVQSVAVVAGSVVIRVDSPSRWRAIAAEVRTALGGALDALDLGGDTWLVEPDGTWDDLPTVDDAQRAVDTAAGSLLAMHGGRIVVTAVEPPEVRVALRGACDGCHGSDSTLLELVEPALRALHPAIERVVPGGAGSGAPGPGPVTVTRIGKRTPGQGCH